MARWTRRERRAAVSDALAAPGLEVPHSEANFVWLPLPDDCLPRYNSPPIRLCQPWNPYSPNPVALFL
jgi:hypothetical protein